MSQSDNLVCFFSLPHGVFFSVSIIYAGHAHAPIQLTLSI